MQLDDRRSAARQTVQDDKKPQRKIVCHTAGNKEQLDKGQTDKQRCAVQEKLQFIRAQRKQHVFPLRRAQIYVQQVCAAEREERVRVAALEKSVVPGLQQGKK